LITNCGPSVLAEHCGAFGFFGKILLKFFTNAKFSPHLIGTGKGNIGMNFNEQSLENTNQLDQKVIDSSQGQWSI
jgi:hypothetical protein